MICIDRGRAYSTTIRTSRTTFDPSKQEVHELELSEEKQVLHPFELGRHIPFSSTRYPSTQVLQIPILIEQSQHFVSDCSHWMHSLLSSI